ncbi:hypothetical protein [Salinispora vitiensis]
METDRYGPVKARFEVVHIALAAAAMETDRYGPVKGGRQRRVVGEPETAAMETDRYGPVKDDLVGSGR